LIFNGFLFLRTTIFQPILLAINLNTDSAIG